MTACSGPLSHYHALAELTNKRGVLLAKESGGCGTMSGNPVMDIMLVATSVARVQCSYGMLGQWWLLSRAETEIEIVKPVVKIGSDLDGSTAASTADVVGRLV